MSAGCNLDCFIVGQTLSELPADQRAKAMKLFKCMCED